MAVNTAFADDTEDDAPAATPAAAPAAPAPVAPQGALQVPAPAPAPAAPGPMSSVLGVVGGGLTDLAKLPFSILGEMGANVQTRIAEDHYMQQQRQMVLNMMGQHLAAIHDMGQDLLAKGDKTNFNLLMAAPDEYIKTELGNKAYQLAKGGDSLVNSQGVGPTAPMLGVTKDGVGYTQIPAAVTMTGSLPTIQTRPAGTNIVPAPPIGPAAPVAVSPAGQPGGPVPAALGTPVPAPPPAPVAAVTGGISPTWAAKALTPQARAIAAQIAAHPAVASLSAQDQANILTTGFNESRFDPNAQNGSSTSLFQFQPAAWKQFGGGGDINNVNDQIAAEAKMYAFNKAALTKALGRDPTGADLYMSTMQGPTGGTALLTAAPGVNAVTALRNAGVPSATALASIAGNLPGYNYHTANGRMAANSAAMKMSAQDFTNIWANQFNRNQAHIFGGASPATGPGTPTMSVSGQPVPPPPPPPAAQPTSEGGWPAALTSPTGDTPLAPGDPALRYQPPGSTGFRHTDGGVTVTPPVFNPETARAAFNTDPTVQKYNEARTSTQGFFNALNNAAGQNNGVLGSAALTTFLQTMSPGTTPRPTTVEQVVKNMGFPEELQSMVLKATGNGNLTPAALQQIAQVTTSYLQAHHDAAVTRMQSDTAAGGPLYAKGVPGESVPDVPAMPSFKAFGAPPSQGALSKQEQFERLQDARMAIAKGAPAAAVRAALLNDGVNPAGL